MNRRGYPMSMVPSRAPDASSQVPGDASAPTAKQPDSAADVLRGLEAALSPVIGQRGVAALCHRALHVSARRHTWLGEMSFDPAAAIDLERLAQVLARHPADARAAGDELIGHFRDLLTSLLGAALTEQLVGGGVYPAHADAPPPQDRTP
jgi:hypothetical protein